MIDEKKLIDDLNKYARENFNLTDEFEWILEGMLKTLDIVERQQKVGEWIPCSERLPSTEKPYKSVLLQLKKSMVVGYINKAGQWFVDTGDGWCADLDEKPIAWMPLPAPYNAERGGKNE